jgi:hypothetical protein
LVAQVAQFGFLFNKRTENYTKINTQQQKQQQQQQQQQ